MSKLNTVGDLRKALQDVSDNLPLAVSLDREGSVFVQVGDFAYVSGECGDLEITLDVYPDTKAFVLQLDERGFL